MVPPPAPAPKVGFNLGESPLNIRAPPREPREQALPIAHPAYVIPPTRTPSPPRVNQPEPADGHSESYPQYPIPPPRIAPRRRLEGSRSDEDDRASPSAQPRSGAKPGGYGFATRAERTPTAPTQRLASLRGLGGSFGFVNRDAKAPRLHEQDEGPETTLARTRSMRAIEAFRQTAVPTACQATTGEAGGKEQVLL